MLFAGILMRPWLMVIGFFLSYLMFAGIGEFLHITLTTFSAGLRSGSPSGLLTLLAVTILSGSITIIYAHKLFGLITWLPDNVMKWIGQQVHNLGESQDSSQAQSHFHGAAGFIYSSGSRGVGAAKNAAGKAKGAGQANEKGGVENSHTSAHKDAQQGKVGI